MHRRMRQYRFAVGRNPPRSAQNSTPRVSNELEAGEAGWHLRPTQLRASAAPVMASLTADRERPMTPTLSTYT